MCAHRSMRTCTCLRARVRSHVRVCAVRTHVCLFEKRCVRIRVFVCVLYRLYVCVCVCLFMPMFACICLCLSVSECACICLRAYVDVFMDVDEHACTRACMYTCASVHVNVCARMRTCQRRRERGREGWRDGGREGERPAATQEREREERERRERERATTRMHACTNHTHVAEQGDPVAPATWAAALHGSMRMLTPTRVSSREFYPLVRTVC